MEIKPTTFVLRDKETNEEFTVVSKIPPRKTFLGVYFYILLNQKGIAYLQENGYDWKDLDEAKAWFMEKTGMPEEGFDTLGNPVTDDKVAARYELTANGEAYNEAFLEAVKAERATAKADTSGKKDAVNIAKIIEHLNKGVSEDLLVPGLEMVVGAEKASKLMEAAKAQIEATKVA